MKSFRQIVAEVAQPSSGDELNFKEKHVIDHILDPNAEEDQFTADKIKKFKNKPDYKKGEDMAVYEDISLTRDVPGQDGKDVDNDGDVDMVDRQLRYRRHAEIKKKIIDEAAEAEMTDAQMKKREEIVLAMKKDAADLKKRYGDEWKSVMYATATKQAMAESSDLRVSEETQQIDEISRKTLVNYARKAPESADDLEQHGYRMSKIGQSHKETGKPVSANAIFQRAGEKIGKAGQRRQYFQKALTKLEALDPVGQEDSDVNNDGKITSTDSYLKARRKAIAKKLQQEGLIDVVEPTGGEFDTEPSHKAYKKKNKGQAHRHGEPLSVKENVSLANAQAGMKVFSGADTSKPSGGNVFAAGAMKLKDGTSINVSKADAEALNAVFETLNPANRQKMQSLAMSSKKGYQDIVSFAKEAI